MPITLTYAIEMTPENAEKIDSINKILLGNIYSEKSEQAENPVESKKVEIKSTPSNPGITLPDVKKAAKEAKLSYGEEFAMQVLKDIGISTADTLGRSMSAIPEDKYNDVIDAWKAGPKTEAIDDLDGCSEDDEFNDEPEIDAEAVKTALKAFAKEKGREKAKEIMEKYKCPALSKVDDLSQSDLTKMMKELV